jgi:hypothetical protein
MVIQRRQWLGPKSLISKMLGNGDLNGQLAEGAVQRSLSQQRAAVPSSAQQVG